jgi:DNA-binding CsgD family transcriptional regulator
VILICVCPEKEAERLKVENVAYQVQLKAQNLFKKCFGGIQNLLQTTQFELIHEDNFAISEYDKISLSQRESEILCLLSLGKPPKEIARVIGKRENKPLSSATVLSIICKQLYRKFGVYSIGDLLHKARLHKLIPFLPDSFSK